MNYHTPDSRWELWGAKTIEEHIGKNVIKGKFHEAVPEDIKKEWLTAEYMMAHAFYHWDMYDEVVKKLYLTFEMAFQLKAKMEDIPTSITKTKKLKNGEVKELTTNVRLVELIDTICNKIPRLEERRMQFHQIRKNRNSVSHPKSYGFAGGSYQPHIIPLLNALNQLFLKKDILSTDYTLLAEKIIQFDHQCLIVELNDKKLLGVNPILVDSINNKGSYYFFTISLIMNTDFEFPYQSKTFDLINLKIAESCIVGKTVEGNTIKIYSTEKKENVERYEFAKKRIEAMNESELTEFKMLSPFAVARDHDRFTYNYAWE